MREKLAFFIMCSCVLLTTIEASNKDLIYAALEKIIILEKTVERLEKKILELENKIANLPIKKPKKDTSYDVASEIAKIRERLRRKEEAKKNAMRLDKFTETKTETKTITNDSNFAIKGFSYIGTKTYSCEEKTNTVKEYVHEETGIEFVLIPHGTYKMGSSYGLENERPIHKVTLGNFLISKYEVTQLIWQKVMNDNPSYFKDKHKPVDKISHKKAEKFCEKMQLRLPTEAEWEYACRAGSTSTYYWGTQNSLDYAWFWDNSSRTTHRVGGKKPNAFGLFDMSGNVMEWCSDIHEEYTSNDVTNPKGAEKGFDYSMRGGSWYSDVKECRSAYRFHKPAKHFKFNVGFRVCKSLD